MLRNNVTEPKKILFRMREPLDLWWQTVWTLVNPVLLQHSHSVACSYAGVRAIQQARGKWQHWWRQNSVTL